MDKESKKKYMAEWYKKNKENSLARSRQWQRDHPERTRETNMKAWKRYYECPVKKAKILNGVIAQRNGNPEKYREISRLSCKKYQEKNAEALAAKRKEKYPFIQKPPREKQNEYHRNMTKNNINHNIKNRLRSSLANALKKSKVTKRHRAIELLGISIEDFRIYLESKFKQGMSWHNKGEWHIDHIKPCATFNLTDIEQQKICFHYSNLQPLWGHENHTKSSMYEGRRFTYKRLQNKI